MPHHRRENFSGQLQIRGIKNTLDRGRELGDVGQRFDQIAIEFGSQRRRFLLDLVTALVRGQDHTVLEQLAFIRRDGHWNR